MHGGRDEVYLNQQERTLSLLAEFKRLQDDARAIGEEVTRKMQKLVSGDAAKSEGETDRSRRQRETGSRE